MLWKLKIRGVRDQLFIIPKINAYKLLTDLEYYFAMIAFVLRPMMEAATPKHEFEIQDHFYENIFVFNQLNFQHTNNRSFSVRKLCISLVSQRILRKRNPE